MLIEVLGQVYPALHGLDGYLEGLGRLHPDVAPGLEDKIAALRAKPGPEERGRLARLFSAPPVEEAKPRKPKPEAETS